MANKFENIRKALMTPMDGLLSGVDIAWPNGEYKPVVGTPYAKLFLLPNQPSSVTNGQDGYDVHTGVFQVSLFYPKSKTDFPSIRAADTIESAYQQYVRGSYLSSGGVSVRITSVGIGTASADEAWYFVPININYESYIKGVI